MRAQQKAATAEEVQQYQRECAEQYEREQDQPMPPDMRPPAPEPERYPLHPKFDGVKALLDRWAGWAGTGNYVGHGAPRQSPGAPDARIHTIEDMEIASDKHVIRTIDTAIWEMPMLERRAIMIHYSIETPGLWKADWDRLFSLAVQNLYSSLKDRLVC